MLGVSRWKKRREKDACVACMPTSQSVRLAVRT